MPAHTEFKSANDAYVSTFGDKGDLPLPPAKHLTVVTCMDARIDPAQHLGLKEGDAHIIRNAGGSARDALRSIVISQRLLGTREIAVFHHTGCGMLTFNSGQLRDIVKRSAPESTSAEVAKQVDGIDFLEFDDLEGSVKEDVAFLKESPLVLPETTVSGWVYEVETGKVRMASRSRLSRMAR
ncbi:carbonic anhydrase [Punctularia strigosozonata HHB-11173 SS5]|uniref:carbonic anhydrase n=1 Tax=Punctularia strigosozonata (strain HHB-11173) TaxID=741275 RepID=UPI00044166E4|nr:carbonic anhydrase [Punctularia strigosozonata HHB-11173 SS5]EIN13373.1 carbonic anhydrase [Punctularia strigosozonata HHB-11173 SS5]